MSTNTTDPTKYLCHSNLQDNSQIDEQQYINSIEQQIFSLPIVKELKNDSSYRESRGYEHIKEEQLNHHFTAGTLNGKGKVTVKPLIFFSEEKKESVTILHIGDHMCGHIGIVHGGFLSTIMDELLARTVIPFLPDKNGATAYLHVNFRKPCKPDQIVIGRSKTTKLEIKKGYVEGTLENLEGVVVVDANALFISVKKLE
ncbi:Thioesterase/thiol ester dehydrase-isomerase [Rhizophagus irregularis]|uniref:Thioesterase/thiol ester dehydrase-isomerase n=1 Tax=Rhizophagus irregularis TaxID=588596 RepID=A0A2N0Q6Z1_9GLOM|nr:Thioesterase/thiol ester dehydrase-isomerase [Rhizophagus irregularis]